MSPERGYHPGRVTSVPEHPRLETLPDWPARTIAALSTVSSCAPTEDCRILLSLGRDRGSLARLRQ
jgi:hypothetical protein